MLRRLLVPVVLLLLALTGGIWLGGHPDRLPAFVSDALVEENTAVVGEALGTLDRRYYREFDSRKVQDTAIGAAVESLGDEFSTYLTPDELKSFNEMKDARFEGIGVVVSEDDRGLLIADVYEGSPAEKAGLKPDDLIVEAAGQSLKGKTTKQGSALIRGKEGTSVVLGIKRGSETFERKVTRAQVRIPVVESEVDAKTKTGTVRLTGFSTDASKELEREIKEVVDKRGVENLVLDLRGNPGGLVEEARLVSSLFLDGGPVVEMKGRAVRTRTLDADKNPPFPKLPLVVLVDENSASASEIVAGALQDRKRAQVVGTRTFGKGVFQEIIDLNSGGALDITVGQYFTPNGRNLGAAATAKGKSVGRGKGIAPNVEAEDDPDTKKIDEAQERAIELVSR